MEEEKKGFELKRIIDNGMLKYDEPVLSVYLDKVLEELYGELVSTYGYVELDFNNEDVVDLVRSFLAENVDKFVPEDIYSVIYYFNKEKVFGTDLYPFYMDKKFVYGLYVPVSKGRVIAYTQDGWLFTEFMAGQERVRIPNDWNEYVVKKDDLGLLIDFIRDVDVDPTEVFIDAGVYRYVQSVLLARKNIGVMGSRYMDALLSLLVMLPEYYSVYFYRTSLFPRVGNRNNVVYFSSFDSRLAGTFDYTVITDLVSNYRVVGAFIGVVSSVDEADVVLHVDRGVVKNIYEGGEELFDGKWLRKSKFVDLGDLYVA